MLLPLSECEKLTGKSRGALMKAIQRGKLSASRDEATGQWRVDAAELSRLYQVRPGDRQNETELTTADSGTSLLSDRVHHLQEKIAMLESERDYLRSALEGEREVVFRLSHQVDKQDNGQDRNETGIVPAKTTWFWIVIAGLSAASAGLAVALYLGHQAQ